MPDNVAGAVLHEIYEDDLLHPATYLYYMCAFSVGFPVRCIIPSPHRDLGMLPEAEDLLSDICRFYSEDQWLELSAPSYALLADCQRSLHMEDQYHTHTSALLRASRAVWNARALPRVVQNCVVAYLELRTTLRYVQRPDRKISPLRRLGQLARNYILLHTVEPL